MPHRILAASTAGVLALAAVSGCASDTPQRAASGARSATATRPAATHPTAAQLAALMPSAAQLAGVKNPTPSAGRVNRPAPTCAPAPAADTQLQISPRAFRDPAT